MGNYGFLSLNNSRRQAQRLHRLAVDGGVGPAGKTKRERGGDTAVTFLNVRIIIDDDLRNRLRNGARLYRKNLVLRHNEFHVLRTTKRFF